MNSRKLDMSMHSVSPFVYNILFVGITHAYPSFSAQSPAFSSETKDNL